MQETKNSVTYSVKTPNGYEVLFTMRDDTPELLLAKMQKLEIHMATQGFEAITKGYKKSNSYSSKGNSNYGNSNSGSEPATEKQEGLIKAKWPLEWKEGMTKGEANNLISAKYGK